MATKRRKTRALGNAKKRPDDLIKIAYGAIPNKRKGQGWLPVVWLNGKQQGNTWSPTGYDRDVACKVARQDAVRERERYIGDWNIKFVDSCARGSKKRDRV